MKKNTQFIIKQLKLAKEAGADVAHFSETCLGGYAGAEFATFKDYDWELYEKCAKEVMAAAKINKIWAIVGGNHRLNGKHKPHNSLYIINSRGQLVNRYDKMFCTGNEKGGDLKHYSPGSDFVTFKIKGITCGVLICFDFRFQELYREYYKKGVQVMFHSFHNSAQDKNSRKKFNIWGVIVPPTLQAYAANNHMWVSSTNTSTPISHWPSFFVNPNGTISGRLINNKPGILVSTVDTKIKYYDASRLWRDRAIKGIYHSGTLVKDQRSKNKKTI